MGKNNRHQKFLKSEKAKVKLKNGKRLTKSLNVTDTSFRVKKILIQSQLAHQPEWEPLTKKNLNLKDLSNRCSHHNTNMRTEALAGLHELASMHRKTLLQNLCVFVSKCANACLDKESVVRKEALKLLSLILSVVEPKQLEPFLSEFASYLTVGLTHLYRDIQEDALLMLDEILMAAPFLVARAAPKLLPAFLDQISTCKNNVAPERALLVNLQSSNTSTRWRIKVLGRLHALLAASVDLQAPSKEAQFERKELLYTASNELFLPININAWDSLCMVQGLFNTGAGELVKQDLFTSANEIKGHLEVLMPLLFETWLEVEPTQKQQKEAGNLIMQEASELLGCILEIMQLVFQLLENSHDTEMLNWFQSRFRDSFLKHILAHFPYLKKDGDSLGKSGRHRSQTPFAEDKFKRCGDQNLAVVLVACIFCNKPSLAQGQLIMEHIKKNLDSTQNVQGRLVQILEIILLHNSKHWMNVGLRLEPLMNSVVTSCMKQKPDLSISPLFNLLCDLSINTVIHKHNQDMGSILERFIQQLPFILTKEIVPAKAMKTITLLVAAVHVGILVSLRTHLSLIIANLNTVCVDGMSKLESRNRVVYLLYSASVWRSDILDAVAHLLVNSSNNEEVLQYFIELLEHWKTYNPESPVAFKLELMPWLTAHRSGIFPVMGNK